MMIQSPSSSLVVTSRTEAESQDRLHRAFANLVAEYSNPRLTYCRVRRFKGDRAKRFSTIRHLVLTNRIFERTAMGVLIRVTWMPETMPGRLDHLMENGRLYIMTSGIR